jgi:hypothetical protein
MEENLYLYIVGIPFSDNLSLQHSSEFHPYPVVHDPDTATKNLDDKDNDKLYLREALPC